MRGEIKNNFISWKNKMLYQFSQISNNVSFAVGHGKEIMNHYPPAILFGSIVSFVSGIFAQTIQNMDGSSDTTRTLLVVSTLAGTIGGIITAIGGVFVSLEKVKSETRMNELTHNKKVYDLETEVKILQKHLDLKNHQDVEIADKVDESMREIEENKEIMRDLDKKIAEKTQQNMDQLSRIGVLLRKLGESGDITTIIERDKEISEKVEVGLGEIERNKQIIQELEIRFEEKMEANAREIKRNRDIIKRLASGQKIHTDDIDKPIS